MEGDIMSGVHIAEYFTKEPSTPWVKLSFINAKGILRTYHFNKAYLGMDGDVKGMKMCVVMSILDGDSGVSELRVTHVS
jgi:hypothetical protein